MQTRPRLTSAGGCQRAGLTARLLQTAALPPRRGLRRALISNARERDRLEASLVVAWAGRAVAGISASRRCCRPPGLLQAPASLERPIEPQPILAEPAGSSTVLQAILLRSPLRLARQRSRSTCPGSVVARPPLSPLIHRRGLKLPADRVVDPLACQPERRARPAAPSNLVLRPPGRRGANLLPVCSAPEGGAEAKRGPEVPKTEPQVAKRPKKATRPPGRAGLALAGGAAGDPDPFKGGESSRIPK